MKGHSYGSKPCKKCGKIHTPPSPPHGWNRGLTKETDERIKKSAEKTSITMTGRKCPKKSEAKKKFYREHPEKHPMRIISIREKVIKKLLETHVRTRQNWKDHREEMLSKMNVSPNKLELKFSRILEENELSFKFVGDRTFWISGTLSGVCRNPDFLYLGYPKVKKVILLDGEYWHKNKNDFAETEDYENRGYEVLRIKELELRTEMSRQEMIEKVRLFSFSKEVSI